MRRTTTPKRGRPAAAEKSFKTIGYRVGKKYLAWLQMVAAANRTSVSGLIDQAVARHAVAIGVNDPPPSRIA
jgi:hypothetical protein